MEMREEIILAYTKIAWGRDFVSFIRIISLIKPGSNPLMSTNNTLNTSYI